MRKLFLIRHAKTHNDSITGKDFDRALTQRGKNNALEMGENLTKRNIIPDLIIASPAMRAKQTATLIAGTIGYNPQDILLVDNLYHCSAATFEDVISSDISNDKQVVFIIAHNPGITEYSNQLTTQIITDNIPTCGIVAVELAIDTWNDIVDKKGTLLFYHYPQKLS